MRHGPALSRMVIVATLCAAATSVSASELKGRVLLATYTTDEIKGPRPGFHWELDNGFKETLKDRVPARREIAVVLTGSGDGAAPKREVVLSGGSLLPSTLVVGVGTTVSIENRDEIAHELYAVGLKGFSAEAISPRGRRAINLKDQGNWALRDQVVPHARGHLHVLPDLVSIAEVDDRGSFRFDKVPPGEYTLRVFHGDKEIASKAVTMTNKALALDPFAPSAPKNGSD